MFAMNPSRYAKPAEFSGYSNRLFNPLGGSMDSVFDPKSGPFDGLLMAQVKESGEVVAAADQAEDEAFDQLVDEKLAADESFRIFITLSNDVLRQLSAAGIDDHLSDS